jgi:hypothetical protein
MVVWFQLKEVEKKIHHKQDTHDHTQGKDQAKQPVSEAGAVEAAFEFRGAIFFGIGKHSAIELALEAEHLVGLWPFGFDQWIVDMRCDGLVQSSNFISRESHGVASLVQVSEHHQGAQGDGEEHDQQEGPIGKERNDASARPIVAVRLDVHPFRGGLECFEFRRVDFVVADLVAGVCAQDAVGDQASKYASVASHGSLRCALGQAAHAPSINAL